MEDIGCAWDTKGDSGILGVAKMAIVAKDDFRSFVPLKVVVLDELLTPELSLSRALLSKIVAICRISKKPRIKTWSP